MKTRLEYDSLGEVAVDASRLYGAQTQRSLDHFWIGGEKMPQEIIEALLLLKACCAKANGKLKLLEPKRAQAIFRACEEQLAKRDERDYPLVVWQTGSGTQTNMNVNEVIASLATHYLQEKSKGSKKVHPNDEVNLGQSSNDLFPSAMHVAVFRLTIARLWPAFDKITEALKRLSKRYQNTVKVGRTHTMDAVPLTYGDVFGSFLGQLQLAKEQIRWSLEQVKALALGATAVGTGLNAHPKFAAIAIAYLNQRLSCDFRQADNLFCALSGHEAMTGFSGALRTLATSLHKMGNDIRFLASGPRCGLGEIQLPENEPGSSIMPGKVNPTQCEALTQVAVQIMGLDSAVSMASALGQFELNVYKPLIAHNVLRSMALLSDAMEQFTQHALESLQVNEKRVEEMVHQSLMLATLLTQKIGYDKASEVVRKAHLEGLSLKVAAMKLRVLTCEQYDAWVQPDLLLGPRAMKKSAVSKKKIKG